MLKVSEINNTNTSFESNKVSQSDGLSDLFKSIYSSKVEKFSENSASKNYQSANSFLHAIDDVPKKSTTVKFNQKRSEMQTKAETARKDSDVDIQKARELLDKIDRKLDKKTNNKIRISRDHLKSALRGLSKLAGQTEEDVATAPDEKKQDIAVDASDAINAGENIVIQFNDTKITFSPNEEKSQDSQDVYEGEVAATTKLSNEPVSNNTSDKSNQPIPIDNQEQQNSGEDLKTQAAEESTTENSGSKIAKKIMDMVEEKSAVAADLMSEDKTLKVEIEPSAKSVKSNSTEKVVSANQASANFLAMPPENPDNKISKIAPSGNLKEILATQNGVLQVNNNVVPPILPNQEGFDQILDVKKDNLPSTEISSLLKKDSMEIPLDTSAGVSANKLAQNTTSASVLDRINQVAMVQKISNRIQLRQLKEFGVVNIHLDPPELGKLIVKLSIKNKDIKVSIIASSDSSHDMLKTHKQVFMKSLRDNGLEVTEFNVSTQDNSGNNSFSQPNNQESALNKSIVSEVNENKNKLIKDDTFNSLDIQDLKGGHQISLIA